MKPICVECSREMRVAKNGVAVHVRYNNEGTPFKEIQSDMFECPECGKKILSGYGKEMHDHVVISATMADPRATIVDLKE